MLQSSLQLASASMLAPALVGCAIVMAFFVCHYQAERKNREDFLRWLDSNMAGALAEPSKPQKLRWAHPSGLYGVGTAARGFGGAVDSVATFIYTRARGYGLAILFVCLALAARSLLGPLLHGRLPYLFFAAAVLLTAAFTGIWETLLALILGFLAAEWFFVEPLNSFMIAGTHGWLGAVLYFVIGLGIVWFKRLEKAAGVQALASDIAYLDGLKELDRERALSAMLAHIVETSPEAVLGLSAKGRIMTWNAAAEKLFGFSRQEAVGQPWALIVPQEERPKAEQVFGHLQRGEPAGPWQVALNRKSGARVEVSLTASSARSAEGKVIGVAVTARPQSPAA